MEDQNRAIPPVSAPGSPSGGGSGATLGAARALEPPANLPTVQEAPGPLVPPSAANPTVPPRQARPPAAAMPLPIETHRASRLHADQPVAPSPQSVSAKPSVQPPPVSAPPVTLAPSPAAPADAPELELPPLSEAAMAFLTSRRYREGETAIAKQFDLTADDMSFLNEMDHLVLGGAIKLDGYARALRGEFPNLPADKKEQLIARIFAERFLAWNNELKPSAAEVARKENLALPAVPYYTVYTKPLTYSGAASEVAHSADIPLGGQIRERLRDLVMSRAKGIRLDAQVEEQIIRPLDMGGLGLEREKARLVVQAIADIISRAKLMTEDEYSAWLAAETQRKVEAAKPVVRRSTTSEDEDGQEIAAIAANMPKQVRDTSSILALSTQTILNRLTNKPKDDYLTRRLENIISTRLRDVRSKNEVLLKIMRDEKVGGVGFARAQAEQTAAQIEEGYEEFRTLIAQEEKEKLGVQTQEQARKVEQRKQREAEEHARWFQEKVQGKRQAEEDKKQMIERLRVVAQGFTTPINLPHPMDAKEQAREKAAFGDLVPATPPSASMPTAEPGGASAPFVIPKSAEKSARLISSDNVAKPSPLNQISQSDTRASEVSVVKVSAESAKAASGEAGMLRPRMDDVKVIRTRLAGPVQELEGLTLSSFRRLGKTPAEAIARVEQKIELLGQESFERRVDAIRAWQASPLQKSYLGLVAEAFSKATPVKELSEQKRAAGDDTPTPEELGAIVELNGKLHF